MLPNSLEGWQPVLAAAGLGLFWMWESFHPFSATTGRLRHAVRNLSVAGINAAAIMLLFSAATIGAAAWSINSGLGLLNQIAMPTWLVVSGSLILLDLWTYLWHRANHLIPLLWRFHRTHHSDEQMDVTTATRFHLGEIVISAVTRLAPLVLLGIPLEAILLYDLVLLAVTQFHHSNIGLGGGCDRRLRYAIVTPNMHRVHHSEERSETDSNCASVLSVWDRIFGTYRERANCHIIRYGLRELRGERFQRLRGLLETPFLAMPNRAG